MKPSEAFKRHREDTVDGDLDPLVDPTGQTTLLMSPSIFHLSWRHSLLTQYILIDMRFLT